MEAAESQLEQVHQVLRASRNTLTARFPSAARACRALRTASKKKAGKYLHERIRRRVTEMRGIETPGNPMLSVRIRIANGRDWENFRLRKCGGLRRLGIPPLRREELAKTGLGAFSLVRAQFPELPKPLFARAESSRLSTSSTWPVRTGTGIIWAIFSPGFTS